MKKAIPGILVCSLVVIMIATSFAASPIRQGPRPIKPGTYGVGRQIPDLTFKGIDGTEQVPTKHQRLFGLLDGNRDDILTTDEVRAAIQRQGDR